MKSIQNRKESPEDIPTPIKSDIMHPDIYYYYRYLNILMQKKGLIDKDSPVIYPGIGSDITTIDTLLGQREIIGFDAAGLKTYHLGEDITSSISWYDAHEVNRCLATMNDPKKQFSKEDFFCMLYEPSYKRKYGGYLTKDLKENSNARNLLGELFSLGIEPKDIICSSGIEQGVKFITFDFNNDVYQPITIYQVDVTENENYEFIKHIIQQKNPAYYVEKSGEKISGFYGNESPVDTIPLEIMNQRKNTKAICIGGRRNLFSSMDFDNNREVLEDIQETPQRENRRSSIQHTLSYELTKSMSSREQFHYQNYRWDMSAYYRK